MLHLLILVLPLVFGLNLAPFFIENQKYEELVPIPLPWNNALYKRVLNINLSVKTNDSYGNIIVANGVEPSDFKIILSLVPNKFKLSFKIGNNTSCEVQVCSDNSKNADLLIDFDHNVIELNQQQKDCNVSILEKKEDSLEISVGGMQQGCIKINGIKISDDNVKLEASRQNYDKCLSAEEYFNDSEEKFVDPGVKVESRGHSHQHKTAS